MSVNLYLKEEIRTAEGFSTKHWEANNTTELEFMGIKISKDSAERLYVSHRDHVPVPSVLLPFLDHVSVYASFLVRVHRETGIYKLGEATAEVQVEILCHREQYSVYITGKKLDETDELLRKIMTGAIRPTESYESPQSGPTITQLENELAVARGAMDKVLDANRELEKKLKKTEEQLTAEMIARQLLEKKVYAVEKLAHTLTGEKWPYSGKHEIARRIRSAINNVYVR